MYVCMYVIMHFTYNNIFKTSLIKAFQGVQS